MATAAAVAALAAAVGTFSGFSANSELPSGSVTRGVSGFHLEAKSRPRGSAITGAIAGRTRSQTAVQTQAPAQAPEALLKQNIAA